MNSKHNTLRSFKTNREIQMSYHGYVVFKQCDSNWSTKGDVYQHKYGSYLQWCLFFTGCPFLVATGHKILLLWRHTVVFDLISYGSLSKIDLFSNSLCVCVIWGKYLSLIESYIWQVRKCSSVSTSFCGQCAHGPSYLESQVCLQRHLSIARLCSLTGSLGHFVESHKFSLIFGQAQWPGILPLVYFLSTLSLSFSLFLSLSLALCLSLSARGGWVPGQPSHLWPGDLLQHCGGLYLHL